MKNLLIILILFPLNVFAGLEKISLVNLDVQYAKPNGKATADKVGIGISLAPEIVDIDITRTENSFELVSPYFDFTWLNPIALVHNMESLTAKKINANLGGTTHTVEADAVFFSPEKGGNYLASGVQGSCLGSTVSGPLEMRLLMDCIEKTNLTIKKIDVPIDNLFYQLLQNLPPVTPEVDIPGDHVILNMTKGDYYFQIYIKYIVYAGLRFWGHMQMEENNSVIAIRVDQVKFGYLPVTSLVMKKLKELIKDPNITVDPPWIRIKR